MADGTSRPHVLRIHAKSMAMTSNVVIVSTINTIVRTMTNMSVGMLRKSLTQIARNALPPGAINNAIMQILVQMIPRLKLA